jgi:hypothetical protein
MCGISGSAASGSGGSPHGQVGTHDSQIPVGGAGVIFNPPYRIRSLALAQETIDQFEGVRARFTEKIHLQMLDVVVNHIRAEWLDLDIDATMGTMGPNPQARVFGAGSRAGLVGYDAIRANYLRQFSFGTNGGGLELERLVIDSEAVIAQGTLVQLGAVVAGAWPEIAAVLDPARTSLVRKHAVLILPFEDGKIAGEFCYFDGTYTPADVVYLD